MMWKLADLIEKHAEEFAQLESLDNGKPLKIARIADVPLAVDHFRYYGGLGHQDRRQHDSDFVGRRKAQFHGLHGARAGGRCRPDHSVEFPAVDGGVETRPALCDRLHGGSSSLPSKRRSPRFASAN